METMLSKKAVLASMISVFALTSCTQADPLIGDWRLVVDEHDEEEQGDVVFSFRDDGTLYSSAWWPGDETVSTGRFEVRESGMLVIQDYALRYYRVLDPASPDYRHYDQRRFSFVELENPPAFLQGEWLPFPEDNIVAESWPLASYQVEGDELVVTLHGEGEEQQLLLQRYIPSRERIGEATRSEKREVSDAEAVVEQYHRHLHEGNVDQATALYSPELKATIGSLFGAGSERAVAAEEAQGVSEAGGLTGVTAEETGGTDGWKRIRTAVTYGNGSSETFDWIVVNHDGTWLLNDFDF